MIARRSMYCSIAIVAISAIAGISCRPRRMDSAANVAVTKAPHPRPERGRHALLVGCAEYINPSIRSLTGPHNDVRLMSEVLVESCGFTPDGITTLTGEAESQNAPTRANIERAFQRLQSVVRQDDQVFILLAGHGSQQPNAADDVDDIEPDGLDEIFLPIDAGRWSGGPAAGVANAIIDDEIYRWASAIAARGAWVWIVFDCCCAGTAIRGDYQEVPRYVSAESELGVPRPLAGEVQSAGTAANGGPPAWEAAGSERIVAVYACQSHEAEPELPLPPRENGGDPERHGLLTYALANVLSEPRQGALSYRDLGREIWLKYRAWGRASPTPFVDGANLSRELLGVGQAQSTFRVVGKSAQGWLMDGGQLHGLKPGSIVAIETPPSANEDDKHSCYARILSVEPTRSHLAPCSYAGIAVVKQLTVGARCEVVFTDFGEMRAAVALDRHGLAQEDAQLVELERSLRLLAAAPTAAILIAGDLASAEWVVARRGGRWQLLPKSAAGLDEAEPLPPGTPSLMLDEQSLASSLEAALDRVFRANNLVRLAASRPQSRATRDPLKLSVQLLRSMHGGKTDGAGEALADGVRLTPGERVQWRVMNEGASAADVTLLFVDSQLHIEAVFPAADDLVADNRLLPGEARTIDATVNADTLGMEQLVAIAVRGRGPQQDFRWLAEPKFASARQAAGAQRGTADHEPSPLARLFEYALYNERTSSVSAVRGFTSADAEDSLLVLRTWSVAPR